MENKELINNVRFLAEEAGVDLSSLSTSELKLVARVAAILAPLSEDERDEIFIAASEEE